MLACTVAWDGCEERVARLAGSPLSAGDAVPLVVLWDGAAAPALPGVRVVGPLDLVDGDPAALLHRYRLTRAQWRAWLQAALVAHLVRTQDATVLAVGLDSLVLAPLDDVLEAAAPGGPVLVSRAPAGVPADGFDPSPTAVAARGAVSDALLAAGPAALPALDWWADRCRTATDDTPWLDLLATRRGAVVLADDGLAVSAASVGTDVVDGTTAHPRLRGTPVRHVDLAGHDPRRPWLLDARLARPRVLLSRQPVLAELVAATVGDTTGAAPAGAEVGVDDLDPQLRDLVRRAVAAPAAFTSPLPAPTGPDAGLPALHDWALEVEPAAAPLTRYLRATYEGRPDVQAAIPHVPHRHLPEFLAWVEQHARHEPHYDASLLERSVARARAATAQVPAPHGATAAGTVPGVHVVGYLRGELGVGESARLVLQALDAVGTPRTSTAISPRLQSRQSVAYADTSRVDRFDTVLLCVNADTTAEAAALVPHLVEGRHRIGMWYWEVEDFPAEQHRGFAHLDEVWVATDFVRDAVAPHAPVPVHVLTPPLPQRHDRPLPGRAALGLPDDRAVVLFAFDYLSTAERKHPEGALEAVRRARRRLAPTTTAPLLVIKSINADARPAEAERLRLAAAGDPDVLLLEDYLSGDERDGLVAACDVYLSLHRAEGLGLTLAEAMAWGKPVVATGYSGNLQFMTPENSLLVPWHPVPVPAGSAPYPAGSPWADPDLDAAAEHLVRVLEDPALAQRLGARAAHDIATRHSPAAAGAAMRARLDERRAAAAQAAAAAAPSGRSWGVLRRR